MCARDCSLAMDPLAQPAPATIADDDEWDAEGFEIPSLKPPGTAAGSEDDEWDAEGFEISKLNGRRDKPAEIVKPILHKPLNTPTENLYLGPHGAKPGAKQQDVHSSGGSKKQRYKQKLRDANQRSNFFAGHENKVEVLRDLIGGKASSAVTPVPRTNTGDWLDPHCHENLFSHNNRSRG